MYKLKEGFTYTKNHTLTGEKLLIGFKEYNSYMLIKKNYEDTFYSLINKLSDDSEVKSFTWKESELIHVFEIKGFFEGGKELKKSFNEYNALVKIIFEKKLFSVTKERKTNRFMLLTIYLAIWILGIINLCINYNVFMSISLDVKQFSFIEIICCILFVPVVIDVMHEFAHYLVASMLGIKVDKITIGFFVTWPTIFLQYKGLNLYSTWKKVCVELAGITVHLLNILIGVFLTSIGVENIILTVWIMANIGMTTGNLMLLGPTDGYFIITSLLGIYNFRYKGYKTLCYFLYKRGEKPKGINLICGALLIVFWGSSFVGIYLTIKYYALIMQIDAWNMYGISTIIIVFLILRFLNSIKKIE